MERFDVVIVGAGPTGLACGIELTRRGLRPVLVEKGCVVNSIYNYPTHMTFFTTPELLEIGDLPMTAIGEKPTRTEALKYYRRVAEHYALDIRQYQNVERIEGEDGDFVVRATDEHGCPRVYAAHKVILATGYYDRPNMMHVPGEHLPKVIHYYKEPHPFYNQDVLVVGAKNSAAIAALELHWSGARVTLVHRGEGISKSVKYWIKPNIENRIAAGEIKAYFRSRVLEIRPDSVRLQTPEGEVTIGNDFVFAMTGYHPDFEFMERHRIDMDDSRARPVTHPDTLESSRKGIYLAGCIVAGMATGEIFIENGRFHGGKIAEDISQKLPASRS
jgi:thioredoxin reductase (NADPH)